MIKKHNRCVRFCKINANEKRHITWYVFLFFLLFPVLNFLMVAIALLFLISFHNILYSTKATSKVLQYNFFFEIISYTLSILWNKSLNHIYHILLGITEHPLCLLPKRVLKQFQSYHSQIASADFCTVSLSTIVMKKSRVHSWIWL